MFSWPSNIDNGIMCLAQKTGISSRYPARLRRDQEYIAYINNMINPIRQAAGRRIIDTSGGAPAPDFTAIGLLEYPLNDHPSDQLLEDAIRGYDGFSGQLFDMPLLHEFAPDSMFLKNASIPQLSTPLVWKRVPAAMRPTSGDPHYVEHVAAEQPACDH
jgi:hypothetical protein